MQTKTTHVDVLVIGGGVVGCAILRALSRYDATIALLERNPDICDGTSKSNSAIIHTGFDAPPGSLEAKLLLRTKFKDSSSCSYGRGGFGKSTLLRRHRDFVLQENQHPFSAKLL